MRSWLAVIAVWKQKVLRLVFSGYPRPETVILPHRTWSCLARCCLTEAPNTSFCKPPIRKSNGNWGDIIYRNRIRKTNDISAGCNPSRRLRQSSHVSQPFKAQTPTLYLPLFLKIVTCHFHQFPDLFRIDKLILFSRSASRIEIWACAWGVVDFSL